MSEQSGEATPGSKRRPDDADLEPLLILISEKHSLRAACRTLGLDPPSTHRWLEADEGRSQQYAHARESRAEHFQEQILEYGEAAATGRAIKINGEDVRIDPAGYRAWLDGVKWATARMAPKTAPVKRVEHSGHISTLTDDELAQRIAAMEGSEDTDED